jgi:hypothetical protein
VEQFAVSFPPEYFVLFTPPVAVAVRFGHRPPPVAGVGSRPTSPIAM